MDNIVICVKLDFFNVLKAVQQLQEKRSVLTELSAVADVISRALGDVTESDNLSNKCGPKSSKNKSSGLKKKERSILEVVNSLV